ncbi:MAG: DUF115 domain-containing protein [Spirochaetales bacterium]|nr:DUF115 domain-containing protein [Spirochaetales bacterium]
MLQLVASSAGPPTAAVRGSYLHSRYDPAREAERFVDRALGRHRPSVVVLLGAGLGYLIQALRQRAPGARVLPVFYDHEIYRAALARAAAARAAPTRESRGAGSLGPVPVPSAPAESQAWHPERGDSLLDFLRAHVRELDSEGLTVMEWPASARLYPDFSELGNRAVRQLLRELRGSLVTTAALGRRWLRNAFRNFVFLERLSPQLPPAGSVVCITASGPSLEEALRLLSPYRNRFSLWALPSSLLALREHGLHPDLVVLTDPGYYAVAHLYPGAGADLEVALPLSAACGTWRIGAAVLPLSQGTFFEAALWALRGIEPIGLPAFGTVAASALALAQRLGASQVLVAGLDLCHRDIRSHARPSLFDLFLEQGSNRLSPFCHRYFAWDATQRGEAVSPDSPGPVRPPLLPRPARPRSSLPLDTYAGWFAHLQRPAGLRLLRLLPSEVPLESFENLDETAFRTYADALAPAAPRLEGPLRGSSPAASADAPSLSTPSEGVAGTPASRAAQARALLSQWVRQLDAVGRRLRDDGIQALLADPLLLPLCYYSDAFALVEAHRRLRLEGPRAAVGRFRELAHSATGVLDAIRAAMETS